MTLPACQHTDIELLSPWELLRKFVCAGCDAVLTCACARDIAVYVLPHQALRGVDADTREHVPVTHPLTKDICYDCRGVLPPANPKAPHRGTASVIHRYYWHELWTRTRSRFLDWCRAEGLPLLDGEGHSRYDELVRAHREDFDRIEADVLTEVRAWHASEPRYDVSRPSDADVLNAANVEVRAVPGSYLTPSPHQKVMVVPVGTVDPSLAVTVEEFVSNDERSRGREVLPLESRPVHCLFGALMWMWVSDISDPRCRVAYFGGRDGVGADQHGLIPLLLPEDFGSPNHSRRRAHALAEHLAFVPDDLNELLWTYDYWLAPSRFLRQYLWAYTGDDEDRARTLITVLGASRIKATLKYLAADYWGRYLGWPDLLTWKQEGPIATQPMLIEVKSSGDRLSDDQRTWVTLNHQTLHLPFHIVKVHRTERLTLSSGSHTQPWSSPPPR